MPPQNGQAPAPEAEASMVDRVAEALLLEGGGGGNGI
jgi:hypothetical protein